MFVYQLLKWTSGEDVSGEQPEKMEEMDDEMVDEHIKAQFISACSFLPTVLTDDSISPADQLYFYARYKQATLGPADPADQPGVFNVRAREKFKQWLSLGNMPIEQAMREYINRLIELDLGWDPLKKYTAGFGLRPSTMADADSSETESSGMSSEQLEWFLALEKGNIERLTEYVKYNKTLLEERDENQLTALHWAADRGKLNLVEFLIHSGADANIQDYSGQTPLHYAAFCSHRLVVTELLKAGADPAIADFEGNCALDLVKDESIKKQLEEAMFAKGDES